MVNVVDNPDIFRQILALLNLALVIGMTVYYAVKGGLK